MKIVKIEHVRCNAYDGQCTFMLGPDNITVERLVVDAYKAQEKYFEAIKNFENSSPRPKYLTLNDFKNSPLTMAEIELKIQQNHEEYDRYNKLKSEATRDFGYYMHQLGYKYIWEDDSKIIAELNWGCRHGQTFNYNETELDSSPISKKDNSLFE